MGGQNPFLQDGRDRGGHHRALDRLVVPPLIGCRAHRRKGFELGEFLLNVSLGMSFVGAENGDDDLKGLEGLGLDGSARIETPGYHGANDVGTGIESGGIADLKQKKTFF